MTTNVTHNEAARRYELTIDGQLVGVANYHRDGNLIDFTHTEIVSTRRDEGLGSVLVEAALDDAERQSLSVLPHCSFVRQHIAEHPDQYAALVPADRRKQFGLEAA
jgi:predicted GNAT family acetyltransferase